MPFELSRRYARLPRWLRVCFDLLVAALGTALVVVVFALVAKGPDVFQPFAGAWGSFGLFAGLAIVTAVLGNEAYQRFHEWETARLPSVREFFHNHDLTKLVGQSLGMSLRACEADLPDAEARVVRRLALRAERDWPTIAQSDRARQWFAGVQDDRLLAFIRDPARLALTDEQTAILLEMLHPDGLEQTPAFVNPATGALVRERLGRRFSEALRQSLKRDFARRGEAAFGLLLDIAGELLNQGAAGLPPTAVNQAAIEEAVRVTRSLVLRMPETQAAALRVQIQAHADRLEATNRAVRAEGLASARRDKVTHRRLALVSVLVLAVGLPTWYWFYRISTSVETGEQATERRLTAIEAQLREALAPKQAGEDPTQRQLPPELLAKARELLEHGNPEQQAVAKIALGMVTGYSSGSYYKFGQDIVAIAARQGVAVEVKDSQGALDNINRIDNIRENVAFGIVQSDVLGYLKRQTPSDRKLASRLRIIFPFYLEEVHILARLEIKSLRDLNGKRVSIGQRGSGTWLTATNLFEMLGISPGQSYNLKLEEAEVQLLSGNLDAVFYVAGKPVKAFEPLNQMAEATDDPEAQAAVAQLHFVPVSNVTDPEVFAEYEQSMIGPQDYPWLDADVPVAAVRAVLVGFDFSSRKSRYYQERCSQFHALGKAVREKHLDCVRIEFVQPVRKGWRGQACVLKHIQEFGDIVGAAEPHLRMGQHRLDRLLNGLLCMESGERVV